MWIAAIELLAILALLCDGVRRRLKRVFEAHPHLIWLVPAGLAGVLCAAAADFGTFSLPLAALAIAYTFAPALCLCAGRVRTAGPQAGWREIVTILLLWGPLESGAGESLIARPMQGRVHAVAYGVAILLACVVCAPRIFIGLMGRPTIRRTFVPTVVLSLKLMAMCWSKEAIGR
jgi:hypothetical protein